MLRSQVSQSTIIINFTPTALCWWAKNNDTLFALRFESSDKETPITTQIVKK